MQRRCNTDKKWKNENLSLNSSVFFNIFAFNLDLMQSPVT